MPPLPAPTFLEAVLREPDAEALLASCPVCAHLIFRDLSAGAIAVAAGSLGVAPLPASVLGGALWRTCALGSATARIAAVLAPDAPAVLAAVRGEMRRSAESPACSDDEGGLEFLSIGGMSLFEGPPMRPRPETVAQGEDEAAAAMERIVRVVLQCAPRGSLAPAPKKAQQLERQLVAARLLAPPEAPAALRGLVTSGGLGFCMAPACQQQWALIAAAIESCSGASRATLLLLLGCLATLDAASFAYPMPASASAAAAANPVRRALFELVVRLADIGLALPIRDAASGRTFFLLSSLVAVAVRGCADAPSAMLHRVDAPKRPRSADGDAAGVPQQQQQQPLYRDEDADTIVTETNFRLYAYTRSSLLLSVLDQFAERTAELDGLVCFRITRQSFVSAVQRGITTAQVVGFLALRAHAVMRRHPAEAARSSGSGGNDGGGGGVVPSSVSDVLRMWEDDVRRVSYVDDAVLLVGLSAATMAQIADALAAAPGARDAVLHSSAGSLVVAGAAFDAIVQPLL